MSFARLSLAFALLLLGGCSAPAPTPPVVRVAPTAPAAEMTKAERARWWIAHNRERRAIARAERELKAARLQLYNQQLQVIGRQWDQRRPVYTAPKRARIQTPAVLPTTLVLSDPPPVAAPPTVTVVSPELPASPEIRPGYPRQEAPAYAPPPPAYAQGASGQGGQDYEYQQPQERGRRNALDSLRLLQQSDLTPPGDVSVRGYWRKGKYVQPYHRSRANGTVRDNYSYSGNRNPYTGAIGRNRYRGRR